MKKSILFLILIGTTNFFAQQQIDSILEIKIKALENKVLKQEKDIKKISLELDKDYWTYRGVKKETLERISKQKNTIDSLNQLINFSNQKLVDVNNNLDSKIKETGQNVDTKIAKLDSSVEKNQLYWIIATLSILLIGGLIYWLLDKRIASSKTDVETQIKNTKTALEEESVKLDSKLVEVLTKQLEVIKTEQPKGSEIKTEDHSLVLKVADRLTAMETNHYRMDPKTKGLKQLVRAVKSIKENYLASGYEIVEMIGQEYKDGVNATVNFIQSDEIEIGKKVITKIIKPQVNFNGKMIQAAQIEVSVGE
jgi:hypothetical protein